MIKFLILIVNVLSDCLVQTGSCETVFRRIPKNVRLFEFFRVVFCGQLTRADSREHKRARVTRGDKSGPVAGLVREARPGGRRGDGGGLSPGGADEDGFQVLWVSTGFQTGRIYERERTSGNGRCAGRRAPGVGIACGGVSGQRLVRRDAPVGRASLVRGVHPPEPGVRGEGAPGVARGGVLPSDGGNRAGDALR